MKMIVASAIAFLIFTLGPSLLAAGGRQQFNSSGVLIENGGTFIMQGGSVSGNSGGSGGVVIAGGLFSMEGGSISGNTGLAGGVAIGSGTFTMEGGIISGNAASEHGAGVHVAGGTFNLRGGTISGGNNARINGGGVYVSSGAFTKTGGTIRGSDVSFNERNSASGRGHAVYWESSPVRWRNASAGPDDNSDDYGFWLND